MLLAIEEGAFVTVLIAGIKRLEALELDLPRVLGTIFTAAHGTMLFKIVPLITQSLRDLMSWLALFYAFYQTVCSNGLQ